MKKLESVNLNSMLNLHTEEKRVHTTLKLENKLLSQFLTCITFVNLKELYLDNTKTDTMIIKDVTCSSNLCNLQLLSLRNCKSITGFVLYHIHNA